MIIAASFILLRTYPYQSGYSIVAARSRIEQTWPSECAFPDLTRCRPRGRAATAIGEGTSENPPRAAPAPPSRGEHFSRLPTEAPQVGVVAVSLAPKQPAAPTKRTLEGSRGSCLPLWSPCFLPRNRSVRRGLLCGRSCPEAPPMRRSRLSPSPPSAQDPLSLRRLGDPSCRAPPEALCHCSASTLLQHLQRLLRAFIVPRIGREHASCP